MTDEIRDLPPIPTWVGSLTDDEYENLKRRSTVRLPIPPSQGCGTCDGEGEFFSWDENGVDVVRYRCNCIDQYLLSLELLKRGIDHEYQRLDWYDPVNVDPSLVEKIISYVGNAKSYIKHGMGFNFHGKSGTGKSLMMYLLAKKLIELGFDVHFTQHNHLLDLYKAGWSNEDDKEYFKARCYRSEILIIDDFGTERHSAKRGVDDTLLDQVLRTRASSDLPTMITTNLDVPALDPSTQGSPYDVRVRSLLSGKNETVVFKGEDFRPARLERKRQEIQKNISRPVVL